jgi:hypothetical protein
LSTFKDESLNCGLMLVVVDDDELVVDVLEAVLMDVDALSEAASRFLVAPADAVETGPVKAVSSKATVNIINVYFDFIVTSI